MNKVRLDVGVANYFHTELEKFNEVNPILYNNIKLIEKYFSTRRRTIFYDGTEHSIYLSICKKYKDVHGYNMYRVSYATKDKEFNEVLYSRLVLLRKLNTRHYALYLYQDKVLQYIKLHKLV